MAENPGEAFYDPATGKWWDGWGNWLNPATGQWVNPQGKVWRDDGSQYGTWTDAPTPATGGGSTPTFTFGAPVSGGGGGGGGSAPTTYTQHTDTDGSVTGVPGTLYQMSSSGQMTVLRWGNTDKPEAGPDADGDGYDDRTGLPVGVIRDSNSPSGYLYKGVPVNYDGSPYTGGPKADDVDIITRQTRDGGIEAIDKNTGKVLWTRPGDAIAGSGGSSGGSSSRTTTVRTVGGSGGGGSYGGVTDADYFRSNESAQARAASAAENAAQRAWQTAQNDLDRQATAEARKQANAIAASQAYSQARREYVDNISSIDPAAVGAFMAAGGGDAATWTPTQSLGLGKTALSQRLLDAQDAQLGGVLDLRQKALNLGGTVDTGPIVPLMADGGTIFDDMFAPDLGYESPESLMQLGKPRAPGAVSYGGVSTVNGTGAPAPSGWGSNHMETLARTAPPPSGYVPRADYSGNIVYNPNAPGNLKYQQYTPPTPTPAATPITKLAGPEGYVRPDGIPDWFEQWAFEHGVTPTKQMLEGFINGQSVGTASGAFNAAHGINMQVQRDENGNIRLDAEGKPMYQGAAIREREPGRTDPMTMIDPATGKAPLQLLQEAAPGFDWWSMYGPNMSEQQLAGAFDWWRSGAPEDPFRSERDAWLAMLINAGANPFGFNGPGGTVLGDPSANPVWQQLQSDAYKKASAAWDTLIRDIKPEWDHTAEGVNRFYQRNPGGALNRGAQGDFVSRGNTGSGGTWDGYVPPSAAALLPDGPRTKAWRDINNAPATYTSMDGATWYVDGSGRLRRAEPGDAAAGGLPGNGTVPGQTYDQAMFKASYYIDPKTGQMVPKAPNSWPPGYTPKVPTRAEGGPVMPGMAIVGDPEPGSNEPNPEVVIAPQGAQVIPLRKLGLGMPAVRQAQREGGLSPSRLGLGQMPRVMPQAPRPQPQTMPTFQPMPLLSGMNHGGLGLGRIPLRADGGPVWGGLTGGNETTPNPLANEPTPQTGGPLPVYEPPPQTGGPLPMAEPQTGGPLPTYQPPTPTPTPATGTVPSGYVTGIFPQFGITPPQPVGGGGGSPTPSTPPPGTGTGTGTGGGIGLGGSGTTGDVRGNVTYQELNPYALNYDLIDQFLREAFEQGRQTKYGIPAASTRWEAQRFRMPGMKRNSIALGA